jgi:hypothetical protein
MLEHRFSLSRKQYADAMLNLKIGKRMILFYLFVVIFSSYSAAASGTKQLNIFDLKLEVVVIIFFVPLIATTILGAVAFKISLYLTYNQNKGFYESSVLEINDLRQVIFKNPNQSLILSLINLLDKRKNNNFYLLHPATSIPIIIPRNGLPRQIDDSLNALVLAKT